MTRLIKQFEGFRSKAYRCPAGVWTIGYGHTAGVTPGMTVSVEEAERLLREDLSPVLDSLPSGLNRNRTAALASLVFNIGIGAFRRSTLRCLVVENPDNPQIATEFTRWVYVHGKVIPGLVCRRRAEAELYFTKPDDYSSTFPKC